MPYAKYYVCVYCTIWLSSDVPDILYRQIFCLSPLQSQHYYTVHLCFRYGETVLFIKVTFLDWTVRIYCFLNNLNLGGELERQLLIGQTAKLRGLPKETWLISSFRRVFTISAGPHTSLSLVSASCLIFPTRF